MASSRKSPSSDLVGAVRAALAPRVARGASVALGLSGGVDSVALLDALATLAPELGFALSCVHVHHGLSPNADAWAAACERLACAYAVPLAVERVDIAPYRSLGVEGAARAARYAAFARQRADFLALAHHRDDQAETVLVQLVRGTGVAGLAGMPAAGPLPGHPQGPKVIRPLLSVARAAIEAHARARGLAWVEDESNADLARARSFVRRRVMPALAELRPDVAAALARSAAHAAEAADLLDALARSDEAASLVEGRLAAGALAALPEPRARNLLRFHLAARGVPVPDARALAEMLRQVVTAKPGAGVEFRLGGFRVRRHRGTLWVEAEAPHGEAAERLWRGEPTLALASPRGILRFEACEGAGLAAHLAGEGIRVGLRRGGERLRLRQDGPRRALKDLLREAGIPPWERSRLPLLFRGEALAWVPGLGGDWSVRARPGEPGLLPVWQSA
ncbi:MAG: tRNA lysidine(34) synthetase TilS [Burkholderiales bacterium]|nr:tRNA lysidine(34) synthetase TilS [Burkholderiales bacterium]